MLIANMNYNPGGAFDCTVHLILPVSTLPSAGNSALLGLLRSYLLHRPRRLPLPTILSTESCDLPSVRTVSVAVAERSMPLPLPPRLSMTVPDRRVFTLAATDRRTQPRQ
jgi:hypothetical protein